MDFRAAPSRGGIIGLTALASVLTAWGLLVFGAWTSGPGPRAAVLGLLAVLLLPACVLLIYWVWGYFSLRYSLSRDSLTIAWAASRQIVPMDAITHVLAGREYATAVRGFRWPGHIVGRTTIRDEGEPERLALVYATVPPSRQLLIVTPSLAYAISPTDAGAFIDDFKMRRRLGPVQAAQQRTEQAFWARSTLWSDPAALWLLVAGFLLGALALAWFTWHYPELPPEVSVQFRYDPVVRAAVPEVLQPVATVWRLPLIGVAAMVFNGLAAVLVHEQARLAALLLLLGAVLVQAGLAVVLSRLTLAL